MSRLALLGPSDGCVGERQDLNAIPHLVRPVRSLASILHSSHNPASLTSRLGATIDVEQNNVRFLGDLILLWDCGGSRRVHGLVPVHPTLNDLPARRRA